MSRIRKFYISDTHFGHANILAVQPRPFANVDEHLIGSIDLDRLPKGWRCLVSEMIEKAHRIAPGVVFERIEARPRGWLFVDYEHRRVRITEGHALSKLVGSYTTLPLHTWHVCGSRFTVPCDGLPLCEPCLSNPAT